MYWPCYFKTLPSVDPNENTRSGLVRSVDPNKTCSPLLVRIWWRRPSERALRALCRYSRLSPGGALLRRSLLTLKMYARTLSKELGGSPKGTFTNQASLSPSKKQAKSFTRSSVEGASKEHYLRL